MNREAEKSRKLFLIFEPAENSDIGGLKDDERSWMAQLVVSAILAGSLEEAAASIGGKIEIREGKESVVWLPEGMFEEKWNGKRYSYGATPDEVEEGFEDLIWRAGPKQEISLGLISPLRSGTHLGLGIMEVPLLAPYG